MPTPIQLVRDILKDLEGRKGIGDELLSIDDDIRKEMEAELAEIVGHYMPPIPRKGQKAIIVDAVHTAPLVHWALCQNLKENESTLRILQRIPKEDRDLTFTERRMLPLTLRDLAKDELLEQIDPWITAVDTCKGLIKEFEFFKDE